MGNLAAVSDYMSNGYIAQRDASNDFGIASLGPGRPAVAACAAWASAALVTLTPERLGLRGRAQARACRTRPRLPAISPRVWASPAALPLRPCLPQGSRAPTDRTVPARSRASSSSSCTTTVAAEIAPPILLLENHGLIQSYRINLKNQKNIETVFCVYAIKYTERILSFLGYSFLCFCFFM